MRLLLLLGFLQGRELAFREDSAILSHLGLQRLEAFLHRLQVVAQPDAADATWRDEQSAFAKFVANPYLPERWILHRKFTDGFFDLRLDAVLDNRFAARDALERLFASRLVHLLVAIERLLRGLLIAATPLGYAITPSPRIRVALGLKSARSSCGCCNLANSKLGNDS